VTFKLPTREELPGGHALLMRRLIPHDVEASIQMLRSIFRRGVSDHKMFGCDRTSHHHKTCLWVVLGR